MTAAEKLPCELVLSSGHTVLLDPDDYVWASRWSWQAHSSSLKRLGQVYAFRATRKPDGRRSGEFLHRVIMGAGPGQVVDHVSGDTLDCRRANLRVTDRRGNAQNIRNSKRLKRGEYKGVYLVRKSGKWAAAIRVSQPGKGRGRQVYLGCYSDPADAARAYDAAALRYFGEYAATNFPQPRDIEWAKEAISKAEAACVPGKDGAR